MVQIAEDAHLAELRHPGDEDKAQVLVIAFEGAEEALENRLVVLLQGVIFQNLQQRLVILVHQHHAAFAGLFLGCHQQGLETVA